MAQTGREQAKRKHPTRQVRSVRLWIDGIPPALNPLMRKHHMEQHKELGAWQMLMLNQAHKLRRYRIWDGEPYDFAHVRAEFYFPTAHRRDPDNHMVCLKALLDGMKRAGLLIDDDFDHCSIEICKGGVRKHSGIEITVTEVDHGEAHPTGVAESQTAGSTDGDGRLGSG